jgi:Leucine-rich repeat (LRR) protein
MPGASLFLSLLTLTITIRALSGYTSDQQINSLYQLYSKTSSLPENDWKWKNIYLYGPKWSFSSPQSDPCSSYNNFTKTYQAWQGLTCSLIPSQCRTRDCSIITIQLRSYDLIGTLPSDLFVNLTTVKTIEISSSSNLFGSLPSSLNQLSALQSCLFNSNQLSGSLPTLSQLTNLLTLDLNSNYLSGSLPSDELFSLPALQFLDLSSNSFTGSLSSISSPSSFSSQQLLLHLNLRSNNITGSIPTQLFLSSLTFLDISRNSLTGSIPSALGSSMSQLLSLDLARNLLTGSFPFSLSSLSLLQHLDLHQNSLSHTLPPSLLTALTRLTLLELSFNQLSHSLPTQLGSLINLSYLIISNNLFTGPIPSSLSALSLLQFLGLSVNPLTGTLPSALSSCSSLNYLSIGNTLISGHIPSEYGSFPHLSGLYLAFNHLSGPIPSHLSSLSLMDLLSLCFNQLTSTIPHEMSQLSQLVTAYLNDNYLTGTIPSQFATISRLAFWTLSSNSLTGTLPTELGSLTSLVTFSVDHNLLTGTIPPQLNSTALYYLSLTDNHFTGTLPPGLFHLSHLVYLLFDSNSLTGSLSTHQILSTSPTSSLLTYLNAADNRLTGTLPADLGSLPRLELVDLSSNHLTGSLPSGLGLLVDLIELYLHKNALVGVLPSSLQQSKNLTRLHLFQNHLSGPISWLPVHSLPRLEQYFLQQNRLTGTIPSPSSSSPSSFFLMNYDVSDNLLTGSLPSHLFLSPLLQSISLSLNCFSHSLPSQLCSASFLEVISMDGLRAAHGCPNQFTLPFTSVTLDQTLDGSIPHCLWSLSHLRVLNLAGNGLTGTIGPDLTPMKNLLSMTLSHNYLSGVIPHSLQKKNMSYLDLSHNKFTGDVDGFKSQSQLTLNIALINASLSLSSVDDHILKLTVNRLSGPLYHSFEVYTSLDVLLGNIFGCDTSLPVNDEHEDWYSCGSTELDQTMSVMGGFVGLIVICLMVYGLSFALSSLNQHDQWCRDPGQDLSQDPHSLSLSSRFLSQANHLVIESHIIFQYIRYPFLLTEAETETGDIRRNTLTINPNPMMRHPRRDSGLNSLKSIIAFGTLLWKIMRSSLLLTIVPLLLLLPLYLIKGYDAEHGAQEEQVPQYVTHTHLYRWLLTMAFLSGLLPALFLLLTALFTLNLFLYSLNSLFLNYENFTKTNSALVARRIFKELSRSLEHRRHLLTSWIIFCLNLLVVGALNGLYLWSLVLDLSTMTRIWIQVSFGSFTFVWSLIVLRVILPLSLNQSRESVLLSTQLNILNSVIIPCITTALSSPSCYQV